MKTAAGCNASSAVGRWCAATLLAWWAWTGVAAAAEGDAEWIWSPSQARNEIPEGECFFRKTFQVTAVEEAQIQITADNRFELTLNGQPVGQGADWRQLQVFDVTGLLRGDRPIGLWSTITTSSICPSPKMSSNGSGRGPSLRLRWQSAP